VVSVEGIKLLSDIDLVVQQYARAMAGIILEKH